jgi:hypothetical protein
MGVAYTLLSLICLCSSGALIAGTWAAMHYMGEECVIKHHCCSNNLTLLLGGTSHPVGTLLARQRPFNMPFKLLFLSYTSWENHRLL